MFLYTDRGRLTERILNPRALVVAFLEFWVKGPKVASDDALVEGVGDFHRVLSQELAEVVLLGYVIIILVVLYNYYR